MSRGFGTRLVDQLFGEHEHEKAPAENEYTTGAEAHPSEGDPAHGIPSRHPPLPGEHYYPSPEPVTHETLEVAPAKPYYSQGMAHGVRSPIQHGGRPAPKPHERDSYRTEDEVIAHRGPYKPEPMPVYLTEPAAGTKSLTRAAFRQVGVIPGADPIPLCDRNDTREMVYLMNETATGGVRLKSGPTSEVGALLPAGQNRYFQLPTQDAVYAVADPSATSEQLLSVIEIYKNPR